MSENTEKRKKVIQFNYLGFEKLNFSNIQINELKEMLKEETGRTLPMVHFYGYVPGDIIHGRLTYGTLPILKLMPNPHAD